MLMKLSNGVELSEETVISALKAKGINVEPRHEFVAGDVAFISGKKSLDGWRLIIKNGKSMRYSSLPLRKILMQVYLLINQHTLCI